MSYATAAERPRTRESIGEAAMRPARNFRPKVDPRLVVGITLVAASVAGTVGIVSASDRTVAVYSLREAVGRGQTLADGVLVESEVALGSLSDGYLRVGDLPEGELVVTRALAAGELVPAAAVEPLSATTTASVVLPVQGPVADGIVPGAFVQVWSLPSSAAGEEGAAMRADGVEVRRLREQDGLLGSSGDVAVELIVNRSDVPALLEAQGSGAAFALVALDSALAGPAS